MRSDIKECDQSDVDCSKQAKCTELEGSYRCDCNKGYTGDGKTCTGQ